LLGSRAVHGSDAAARKAELEQVGEGLHQLGAVYRPGLGGARKRVVGPARERVLCPFGQVGGLERDQLAAMRRVEEELNGNPDKRAYFVCVLALAKPGAATETFEGRVYGALTFPPRGIFGFGYDPIFIPEHGRFTFGEMDPKAKHAVSHRARAFEKFVAGAIHPSTE